MAKISKMREYRPIVGDDDPVYSLALRDCPRSFMDLIFPDRCPRTAALKNRLCGFADRYYRNHEIIGLTVKDWLTDLQLSLDMNVDTFERLLMVYDTEIAMPGMGRRTVRSGSSSEETGGSAAGQTRSFDLPADNGDDQEVSRDESESSSSGSRSSQRLETEEVTDRGAVDQWTKLNGFLDSNRTLEEVFVSYFKDNFTLYEVMKW